LRQLERGKEVLHGRGKGLAFRSGGALQLHRGRIDSIRFAALRIENRWLLLTGRGVRIRLLIGVGIPGKLGQLDTWTSIFLFYF
jgi:hypothetical protein